MTEEEQQIAIAEVCGWKLVAYKNKYDEPKTMWHHPDGAPIGYIPNYLTDLNAIHSAWLTLNVREKQDYISTLRNICAVDGTWAECAEPKQHAKAFLAVKGKLKDS